jgi:hypothetical protein
LPVPFSTAFLAPPLECDAATGVRTARRHGH